MNILYITMCLPFKNASHAGGKTVYYYISQFSKSENVKLVSKVKDDEKKYEVQIPDNCKLYQVYMPKSKIERYFAYLKSINSKINPFYRYGNTLLSYTYNQFYQTLLEMKKTGYYPDVIVMEWTQIVLMINEIKNVYPNAIIVASEHDVIFQSLERKIKNSKGLIKYYRICQYNNQKKRELDCLLKSDIVLVQSHKDKRILVQNGIEEDKQIVISPFYMTTDKKWLGVGKKNIVIYGDMSRVENYGAVIWFIGNVFYRIHDKAIKLYILGGHPSKELYKYKNDRIVITGFVDDIFSYLNDSFCMVAPLQIGAGIKVKCIEALSFGIPLLANDIAIEGINVINGVDYLYCNAADDFLKKIEELYMDTNLQKQLSCNSILHISELFNLNTSFEEIKKKIEKEMSVKNNQM